MQRLIDFFIRFPGVGPRQAKRFAYYVLSLDESATRAFADALGAARRDFIRCADCYRLAPLKRDALCDFCADERVDDDLLMVVEKEADVETIHRSGTYNGRFFVLGGLIPILEKEPQKKIRLKELLEFVARRLKANRLKEVILALTVSPEGDYTVDRLKEALESFSKQKIVTVSLLGRGLSTGTELEYSDSDTIKNALRNRG
jgi:recombination protein RecR